MPLYRDCTTENVSILIWKYEEGEDLPPELAGKDDADKISRYHPKKLLEYLMVRKMLNILKPGFEIKYKKNGQPYLFPPQYYISISHSFPFAAISLSKKRTGIDLEKTVEKIVNLKHKYLNDYELQWTQNSQQTQMLTVIWAIKEALYKLHPCKYWSLKKYYEVEKFSLDNLSNIKCRVFDDQFEDIYTANVIVIEDYYFAVIEENHQINFKIPADHPTTDF